MMQKRQAMSAMLFRKGSCLLFSKSHDRWLDETKTKRKQNDKTRQLKARQEKTRLYRLLFVYHLQLIIQLLSWVWKFKFNTYHSTARHLRRRRRWWRHKQESTNKCVWKARFLFDLLSYFFSSLFFTYSCCFNGIGKKWPNRATLGKLCLPFAQAAHLFA